MPSTSRNSTFSHLVSVARSLKPFGSAVFVSKRDVSTENRVELVEGKETKVKYCFCWSLNSAIGFEVLVFACF